MAKCVLLQRPNRGGRPGGTTNTGQRFSGRRAQSGQALLLSNTGPVRVSVRSGCVGTRHVVSRGRKDSPGHGQPQYPHAKVPPLRFRIEDGITGLAAVCHSLHSQAWKLAKSGRDRDWYLCQTMPGHPPDSRPPNLAATVQGVDPANQLRNFTIPISVSERSEAGFLIVIGVIGLVKDFFSF